MTRRALLVEDHGPVRQVLELLLQDMGFEVLSVADGHAGVAAAAEIEMALLVTDLRLPGPGGIEVARAALARLPDLPVLVVSGNVGADDERTVVELGAGLLRKPFTAGQLAAAVDALSA